MKYIDTDKLIAEIERWRDKEKEKYNESTYSMGRCDALAEFRNYIVSLQQEQPEDVVVVARAFLDVLSETPYNNKPITDAQIIVKQLLIFLETPSKYNPDAILEQPEVDLEKEIDSCWQGWVSPSNQSSVLGVLPKSEFSMYARHFFNLGLNARKEGRL